MVLLNPFDPKTVLLAKHAQHVVLIHFPVALFISGVVFGWIGQWKARRGLQDAGYYKLLQSPAGCRLDDPHHYIGPACLAAPTGRPETQGHAPSASNFCLRFCGADLAGLVAAPLRSQSWAPALNGAYIYRSGRTGHHCRDGAFGWLFDCR